MDRWKIRKTRPTRLTDTTPWAAKHPYSDKWAHFASWAEAYRYATDERRDEGFDA